MQEQINGRSPYLQTIKTKQAIIFPKIAKVGRQYNPESTCQVPQNHPQQKPEPQPHQPPKQSLKPELDNDRITHSKQYKDLQQGILNMQQKFTKQMQDIQKKKMKINEKIKVQYAVNHRKKYQLWELRNQIIGLEGLVVEEQNQFDRMLYELGYVQVQEGNDGHEYGEDGYDQQGQYQEIYE